jgi:methionyl-tRNA formyltransferase
MLGTGDFAAPTFRALYSAHQVLALYTQPDRSLVGRTRNQNILKPIAEEHGTPIFQPEKVNTPEELERLRSFGADLFVVAAYGQILSRAFLAIPPKGTINVHASLLPKYRGAAPINYAILKGETETGVSIIEVQPKLDAGPVFAMERLTIGPQETTGELEPRLADLGGPLTLRVLEQIEQGTAQRVPQDDAAATFSPKMPKDFGLVDWNWSAIEIERQVRALQPWPTAFTYLHQAGKEPRRLVLRQVVPVDRSSDKAAGTVITAEGDQLFVQTGQGALAVQKIQPEGKRVMDVAEWLRGRPLSAGDRLGPR